MNVICQFVDPKPVPRRYPYIGKSERELYVFFHEPRKGMVIFDGKEHTGKNRCGEYAEGWCEDEFFEYTKDRITLANE